MYVTMMMVIHAMSVHQVHMIVLMTAGIMMKMVSVMMVILMMIMMAH